MCDILSSSAANQGDNTISPWLAADEDTRCMMEKNIYIYI